METLLLWLHILNGSAALLAGAGALLARKGGKYHARAGVIFFWAMAVVLATAVLLALYKTNFFLLCIAVFSFYLTYTGYRAAHFSRQQSFGPGLTDKLVLWLTTAVATVMVGMGLLPLLQGKAGMHLVLLVFGFILLLNCMLDIRLFYFNISLPPRAFLLSHIGRMCGAYIATITAVLVTNFHAEPQFLVWLLPTAIGTPFISISINRWRKKLRLVHA